MEKSNKKLGLGRPELYALAVGQVIGAGVFTVLGSAIAATGKSAWLAYAIAVIVGFFTILPFLVMSDVAKVNGGMYSMVSGLAGTKWAGVLQYSFIPNAFSFSLFGLSVGTYVYSLFGLDARIVGIIAITVFYLINLLPIKQMAKVQKVMTAILLLVLVMFCCFGLPKINGAPFEFASEDYFNGGAMGFLTAIVLLSYSTTSYSFVINYSGAARRPKKDLPFAILGAAVSILVLYSLVGIVSTGVLPIAQVADQPLTYVADAVMPKFMFYVLIGGGVLMALATTLNSQFGSFSQLYLQGSRDGWYPKALAKTNKAGQPWVLLTIAYAIAILPLILNFDVTTITNTINVMAYLVGFIPRIAIFSLPKLFPEACAKSKIYRNRGWFNFMMILSNVFSVLILALSLTSLSLGIIIATVVALALCVVFAFVRTKQNAVNVEASLVPYTE